MTKVLVSAIAVMLVASGTSDAPIAAPGLGLPLGSGAPTEGASGGMAPLAPHPDDFIAHTIARMEQALRDEQWFEAEREAWYEAERQAWYAAERANAARASAVRNGYPALTAAGLEALIHCESGAHGRHSANTNNGFRGAVQWIQATWNAAAARAGHHEWVGVPVEQVPASIQDAVTYSWWSASNPAGQWPVCHHRALAAMS